MRKKYMSTEFQKNDISIETVIVEILEKNKWYENCQKFKNAFKCASTTGKPRLCVAWERYPNIEEGDLIKMIGWIKNEVFFVKSLVIVRKGAGECLPK